MEDGRWKRWERERERETVSEWEKEVAAKGEGSRKKSCGLDGVVMNGWDCPSEMNSEFHAFTTHNTIKMNSVSLPTF